MRIDKRIIQARIDELSELTKGQHDESNWGGHGSFKAAITTIALKAEMDTLQTVLNAIEDDNGV